MTFLSLITPITNSTPLSRGAFCKRVRFRAFNNQTVPTKFREDFFRRLVFPECGAAALVQPSRIAASQVRRTRSLIRTLWRRVSPVPTGNHSRDIPKIHFGPHARRLIHRRLLLEAVKVAVAAVFELPCRGADLPTTGLLPC